jgi:hypothetical protein
VEEGGWRRGVKGGGGGNEEGGWTRSSGVEWGVSVTRCEIVRLVNRRETVRV